MIPLCVLSIPRKSMSIPTNRPANVYVVSQHGLGLDMWFVEFDNITSILYVRTIAPRSDHYLTSAVLLLG